MSVILDPPSQLFFERPLTVAASETLTLTNAEDEPIAFKVKTTSPKQYCVRPNSGKIEPGEKVQVQILLQPFKDEPADDFKCKDKFLVQSIIIPPEKVDLPTSQLWSSLEGEKSSVRERKLRCVFLPPGASSKDRANEEAPSSPPSYSAQPTYSTVRETPINRQPSEPKYDSKSESSTQANNTSAQTKSEDIGALKEELKQAMSSINQLKKDLTAAQSQLKTTEAKGYNSSTTTTQASSSELNVQALGGVALVAFLLGVWLF